MNVLNISEITKNPEILETLTLTANRPPSQEERLSKIKQEEWSAIVSHIIKIIISIFSIIVISTFLYICGTTAINATATVDDKKWSTALITLVIGGLIGYISGSGKIINQN